MSRYDGTIICLPHLWTCALRANFESASFFIWAANRKVAVSISRRSPSCDYALATALTTLSVLSFNLFRVIQKWAIQAVVQVLQHMAIWWCLPHHLEFSTQRID